MGGVVRPDTGRTELDKIPLLEAQANQILRGPACETVPVHFHSDLALIPELWVLSTFFLRVFELWSNR